MTTLAIIGGGIAGRSLLYSLSSGNFPFNEVLFFDSPAFAPSCSLTSTAIVASRGVSSGHSELGDLLVEGYRLFSEHVVSDSPEGVFQITQETGALTKLNQFKKRYPQGHMEGPFYMASENAFLIDPDLYLEWLYRSADKRLPIIKKNEFITGVDEHGHLKTQEGHRYHADQVVFCTGANSKYWAPISTVAQGSYLEFESVTWERPSFSQTLEGQNIIYHAHSHKLLLGSTTSSDNHLLAPIGELKKIYEFFSQKYELPLFEMATCRVGLREKAPKRLPYLTHQGKIHKMGGFYKNGYSLALSFSEKMKKGLIPN